MMAHRDEYRALLADVLTLIAWRRQNDPLMAAIIETLYAPLPRVTQPSMAVHPSHVKYLETILDGAYASQNDTGRAQR